MKFIREFFQNEDGQASTEYILILAVVVSLAVMVGGWLRREVLPRLLNLMNQRFESMFNPQNLHYYRIN